ncbi:50S ribosomal protein L18 [archaeon]|nr:50S ribosomal protein L18 [archaeon]
MKKKHKQKKLDVRRRRECKTDYRKRLVLLKGNKPRLVVRKSNKYILLQIVESSKAQDKVLFSVNSKELLSKGWPKDKEGSLKNLSAGYLAGFLLGKKAKDLKGSVILDSGLIPNTRGSRVYAVVKGLSDAGVEIPFDEKVMFSEEEIAEKIGKDVFEKVKGGLA